jgi:hypothetical protein
MLKRLLQGPMSEAFPRSHASNSAARKKKEKNKQTKKKRLIVLSTGLPFSFSIVVLLRALV